MQSILQTCPHCGAKTSIDYIPSINVQTEPELKEKVLSGELFTWTCPSCGGKALLKAPLLYHDPKERLMLLLTDLDLKSEELPQGYSGRLVGSAGELIEKVKIADAGLDDIVIEMCKYVTLSEMQKDLRLHFFQLKGADSTLIFAYSDGTQMQLLSVGFNVYEDCAGIVSRNPGIKKSAQGLVRVDLDWISKFFA